EKTTTPTVTNLTIPQQQQITTLLKQNDNLFADNLSQLGHTKVENHYIPIKVSIPVRQRAYRVAPPEQDFIKKEINKIATRVYHLFETFGAQQIMVTQILTLTMVKTLKFSEFQDLLCKAMEISVGTEILS
ncbi:10950_t:CDS:2, partial [Funneliformis geosporum]